MIACTLGLFGTVRAQETILVGDGADVSTWAQAYNTPVDVYSSYYLSQQIYTADEIMSAGGSAGTITQIAFKRAPNSGGPTRDWSIYLTNTTESSFPYSTFLVSSSDKVYSGSFAICEDWNVFELSDFEYTGGNLLVTVVDNSGVGGGDVFWYGHASSLAVAAGRSTQYAPESLTESMAPGYTNRNYIQLTFAAAGEGGEEPETPVDPEPEQPTEPETPGEALSEFFYDFNDSSLEGWNIFQGSAATGEGWALGSGAANGGNGDTPCVFSASWNNYNMVPDNYIVTANAYAITSESVLSWYVKHSNYASYAPFDPYEVVVSTDGVNFESVQNYTAEMGVYTKELSLAAYAGQTLYIGFHHYYGMGYGEFLMIDDIKLTAGEGGETPETPTEPETPVAPAAPANLVATANGQNSIVVTWEAVEGATDYYVYKDGQMWANTNGATTYTENGLSAGTQYCFKVQAVADDLESELSEEACATTEAEEPTEPEQPEGDIVELVIETGTDMNPNATGNYYLPIYDYAKYAMSQQIYTAEELGGNVGPINSVAFKLGAWTRTPETRQYEVYLTNTDLNMFNGNTFVALSEEDKVFDGDVEIEGTIDTWFTIEFDKPFNYTGGNIVLTVYDKTGVSLTSTYHQFYKYAAASRSLYKQNNTSAYDMFNLGTGIYQTYVSQIRVGMTISMVLTAPANVVATAQGSSAISLSWYAVGVAASYNVYNGTELVANVEGTTYTVEGLTPETTYCYTVTAVKEDGEESEASAEVCATTTVVAPATPTNLVATSNGETSVSLTWDAVETAASYNVYSGTSLVANVEEAAYTVEGLDAETTYCFTVTAVNNGGESAASAEACATTDEFTGCYLILTMTDSWGDGWNGNVLVFEYGSVSKQFTLANGKTGTETLAISKGAHVTMTYKLGGSSTYPQENGFTVAYDNGQEIVSAAQNTLTTSTSWEFDVDCTPVAPNAPVVKAEATGGSTIALTMSSTGADSYNVYLGEEAIVTGLTENKYTVENLEAATEYCFSITAVNEVGESEASEACATTFEEGSIIVSIGEGEIAQFSAPIYNAATYSYSLSQQIYTAEEIGLEDGTSIKSISFHHVSGNNNTRDIVVYLQNVEKGVFEGSYDWIEVSDADIVYQGTYTFGVAEDWATIEFQNAFEYAGANVAVTVYDKTGTSYGYSYDICDKFYSSQVNDWRGMFYTKTSEIDLTTISSLYGSYMYTGSYGVPANVYYVNNIKFRAVEAGETPEEPEQPIEPETPAYVQIGEGEYYNSSYSKQVPICDYYTYFASQTIYTAEEIGVEAGVISSIAYNLQAAYNHTRNIAVYMKNTDRTEAYSSWETFTADNCVYSGDYTFETTGWATIELQNAFEYTGGNLLITVVDNTGAYTEDGNIDYFYLYATGVLASTDDIKCIYKNSGATIDPLNITLQKSYLYASIDGANTCLAPQIRLGFGANEGGDEPIVDGTEYRLVSTGVDYNALEYVYESETSDKVIEIRKGQNYGYGQDITFLQYDENGVLTGYEYGWAENGALVKTGSNYQYTDVEYTYTDGLVAAYTETTYSGWSEPSATEYTITRDAEGNITEVASGTSKVVYAYENGKLVSEVKSYYNQWAETPGYETEYEIEYTYDENGNCTVATQYSTYSGERVARKATEYVYATTIPAENVVAFAYPHAVAPAHANLIAKAISYEFREDYNTGEITKDYFTVTPYVYNPEVVSEPLAPMGLTVSAVSDTELRLSWVALESAEKFNIYKGGEFFAESESETYYATGLEIGTEYCFSVSAVNGEFESPVSETVCGKTLDLVAIYPAEIAFGEVRVGNYWAKEETTASVEIDPLGKTITAITCDNAFFTVPTIDLTASYIMFELGYDKTAEAGEYTGNLVVTLEGGETVTAPVTATAYAPATADVFELAQEITFVDGVYTDTPDFATLHDDYLMPGEGEWNDGKLMDAVYTFTLETPSAVTVKVAGENAQYAIYKAEGFEYPTEETFNGVDRAITTAFSFDFNDGELGAFTIQDNDEYQDYSWDVEEDENGGYKLTSYSYLGWWGESGNWEWFADADERIITNEAYNITEKSVLTFDMNVNGQFEGVIIEVTKDGETFTTIENILETSYSYEWLAKRVNIGAKLAELGLEYGEYRISLYHDMQGYGELNIDNLVLAERELAFPEGTYYLFAAAEKDLAVEVSVVETEEVVIVPEAKAYRLESVESFMATVYTYDEVFTNRVVEMEEEGVVSTLSYNKAGQLVNVVQLYDTFDENDNPVVATLSEISYTYNEDGTLATYTETAPTPTGAMATTTTEYTYEDGRLAKVENADYEIEMTYVYNEDGTVKEIVEPYMTTSFTYEEGNLVKTTIGWDDEETGEFFVEAEEVYTYANGNVVKQESYEYGSLYQVHEFFYDATIFAEDVYTFELPHMAIASVEPTSNNVLAKELSYYSYYDEEAGETIVHSYTMTVYNYNPAIVLAPVTPINFAAEVVDGVVELTWEAFADAETFTVYQDGEVIANNVTEGFYAVEGLSAGEYCFVVRAYNAAGASAATNEACVTVEGGEPTPTVPAAPVLSGEATGPYEIVLSWTEVEGATSYNLYYGEQLLGNTEGLGGKISVDEAGAEYCFTVTAVNAAGESEHSNVVCVTTPKEDSIEENATALNIYPNPAVDRVVIETEATIEAVSIYTLTGVMIYSEVDFNNNTINVTDFASGVYVMKVRTENGEVVKRFIKK